jgi:tetratricopeptide (TPR) repeat protein
MVDNFQEHSSDVNYRTGQRQFSGAVIFLSVLICIIISILYWSMTQLESLRSQAFAANNHIQQLNREIAVLQADLEKLQPVDAEIAPQIIDLESNLSARARSLADAVVAMRIPGTAELSQDMNNAASLQDTEEPLQESVGMTAGRREFTKLQYDKAIEQFERVESSAADYIAARLAVANAYFYSHRFRNAVTAFSFVLELQPGSVEAVIGLANSHHRLGQRSEQIAAYDKAIEIEPRQWLHYNSRATAYLLDGNNEQAMLDFQQAAQVASSVRADQVTALENVGLIYLREQQWQTALDHADELNQLDDTHAWNWLVRGIAAAKLERNVDAYVSFDNWFKFKKSTDPYLLKQILPESVHAFVDVSPAGLTRLVDPPKISGDVCDNDSQCKSYSCKPGPPDNKINYCVMEDSDCSAAGSNGYLLDEILEIDGIRHRCYQLRAGNARWTIEGRSGR